MTETLASGNCDPPVHKVTPDSSPNNKNAATFREFWSSEEFTALTKRTIQLKEDSNTNTNHTSQNSNIRCRSRLPTSPASTRFWRPLQLPPLPLPLPPVSSGGGLMRPPPGFDMFAAAANGFRPPYPPFFHPPPSSHPTLMRFPNLPPISSLCMSLRPADAAWRLPAPPVSQSSPPFLPPGCTLKPLSVHVNPPPPKSTALDAFQPQLRSPPASSLSSCSPFQHFLSSIAFQHMPYRGLQPQHVPMDNSLVFRNRPASVMPSSPSMFPLPCFPATPVEPAPSSAEDSSSAVLPPVTTRPLRGPRSSATRRQPQQPRQPRQQHTAYSPRRCQRCTCENCLNGKNSRQSSGSGKPPGPHRKSHLCHICGRTYGKTSHLQAHIRWHNNERPFQCTFPLCSKAFTRSDELQRHIRTHSGIKNFACEYCQKRFMRSDHLSKHRKTHESREGFGGVDGRNVGLLETNMALAAAAAASNHSGKAFGALFRRSTSSTTAGTVASTVATRRNHRKRLQKYFLNMAAAAAVAAAASAAASNAGGVGSMRSNFKLMEHHPAMMLQHPSVPPPAHLLSSCGHQQQNSPAPMSKEGLEVQDISSSSLETEREMLKLRTSQQMMGSTNVSAEDDSAETMPLPLSSTSLESHHFSCTASEDEDADEEEEIEVVDSM